MSGAKTIRVDYMARVEGEASLLVKVKGGAVQDVKLKIFEPPRLFEALLRGRHYSEAPDITARICGICPVAYQMTSVHAIENALGVTIHPQVRLLRRLFYTGEWLESHALHIYMLHAPDFLGCHNVMEVAQKHPEVVAEALRLKKLGNRIVSTIGGREVHPVSVCVGGFYKVPTRADLLALREELKWALDVAAEKVRFVAGFEYPDFDQPYEFVALSHPDEYPFNEGRLVSNRGLDIEASEYEEHFVEKHVKHTHALHSQIRARGSYLTGPLARFNLNHEKLPAVAKQAAEAAGLRAPCLNPFRSLVVRAVEMVFAIEEALRVIDVYEPPPAPHLDLPRRGGAGFAITEAPRGINYNYYRFDDKGLIEIARIVPPTSQNQKQIEEDLAAFVPGLLELPQAELTHKCEQAVRNYDPCISCATHFLTVKVENVKEDAC
ncbi:MAG TPA: nickel-dependent hydrogenase large subunit [Bryobacteraceae bacterium]|jgi:coenzyme F420-reducing hydrogenase alpha subunit